MAEQGKIQKKDHGPKEQPEQEKKFAPESVVWELPNSVMAAMPTPPPPPDSPNSVMREMFDSRAPGAGARGNSLSAGFHPGMPNSVMREMSSSPGQDFSSIHFHSNSQSVLQNAFMGSRTSARNGDGVSGREASSPSVTAHESVHFIHTGTGQVSRSVPSGTIQREPEEDSPLEKFRRAVRKVILINRVKKALSGGKENPAPKPGEEPLPGHKPETLPPAPAAATVTDDESVVHSPIPTRNVDPSGGLSSASSTPQLTDDREDDSPPLAGESHTPDLPNNLWIMIAGGRWLRADEFQPEIQRDTWLFDRAHTTSRPVRDDGLPVRESARHGFYFAVNNGQIEVSTDGRDWYQASTQAPAPEPSRPDRDDSPPGGTASGSDSPEDPEMTRLASDVTDGSPSLSPSPAPAADSPAPAALPDQNTVFGTGGKHRWRISRKALTQQQIDGMVEYYKARYRRIRHSEPDAHADVVAPVRAGLDETESEIRSASRGQPQEGAEVDGGIAESAVGSAAQQQGTYHAPHGQTAKLANGYVEAGRQALAAANYGGRFGVLIDHYQHHVLDSAKEGLSAWDENKWKLPTSGHPVKDSNGNVVSAGSYDPYVNYVAPIAATALGGVGTLTGLVSMGTSGMDTVRNIRNHAVGASAADAVQSGIDTLSATGSTMSSAWNMAQGIGTIGGTVANTFGNAADAIPGLSIATGGLSAISGGMQAVRAGIAKSEINGALKDIDAAAPASAQEQAQQDYLRKIALQGKSVQNINLTTGALKAAAGASSLIGGALTLGGVAPVAAGFQAVGAILSVAKFAFERGMKRRLRKNVLAEELNIDWYWEMADVRNMVHTYNPKLDLKDREVREIILKAHGSQDSDWKKAFKSINLKRANFLINLANNPGQYQNVASTVIEAMGIHKRGGRFADGAAAALLAEKLG